MIGDCCRRCSNQLAAPMWCQCSCHDPEVERLTTDEIIWFHTRCRVAMGLVRLAGGPLRVAGRTIESDPST